MKGRYRKIAVLVVGSLLSGSAGAAYKCLEDGGRIFYQDAPCPARTQGGELHQNVNRTFSGRAPPPAFETPQTPCCAPESTHPSSSPPPPAPKAADPPPPSSPTVASPPETAPPAAASSPP